MSGVDGSGGWGGGGCRLREAQLYIGLGSVSGEILGEKSLSLLTDLSHGKNSG